MFLAAAGLMLPSLIFGPSALDSGPYNYTWTRQFADALGRGELYPRWMSDSFQGLGSPTFFFYPPLAFYLTGLIDLAGASTWQAISLAGLLLIWASGLAMWFWIRSKSKRPVLWACLYMAAPYHLADFYIRAALAEFAAYAWLPLIVMGIDRRPRLLAVAFAGLVCTHLPTAVLCTAFLIGPLEVAKLVKRKPIGGDLIAGLVGLALSAIYLLPALTLQRYVSIEALFDVGFRPAEMSVWFRNLPLVHVATAGGVMALAAAVIWQDRSMGAPRGWAMMAMVCAALAVGLVPGLWALPVLEKVQFPYRLLSVAEFAVVTAIALRLENAAAGLAIRLGLYALLFAWVLNVAAATEIGLLHRDASAYRAIERSLPDAPEYLPAGAAPKGLGYNRDPQVHRFLPADRFNFPIWRMVQDGRENKVVGYTIPLGATVVRRALPIETAGAALSCLGALFLLAWAALARRRQGPAGRGERLRV
ncbi:MAG TPA: hypothetical protein VF495_21515 [Phenylobacterium sp.]